MQGHTKEPGSPAPICTAPDQEAELRAGYGASLWAQPTAQASAPQTVQKYRSRGHLVFGRASNKSASHDIRNWKVAPYHPPLPMDASGICSVKENISCQILLEKLPLGFQVTWFIASKCSSM